MTTMLNTVRRFLQQDDAQDLLEYAMLIALISIFAMGAVSTVGNTINGVFWEAISAATDDL
jgi:Flp pilus assembly pilin Flp